MGVFDDFAETLGLKSKAKPKSFQQSDAGYDPRKFEYGGREGKAEEDVYRLEQREQDWQNRSNEYHAQQQDLFNRGNVGMDLGIQARGGQDLVARQMLARAQGRIPSIAQQQANLGMQQLAAEQASAAASARGPAALALAQQNAAANTAQAQGSLQANAAIAAAQERLAAEQAAYGAYSGMRGQDYQGAQVGYGAAGQMGQLGLGAGQLGLGYVGAQQNVRGMQQQGAMQQQQMLANSHGQTEQTKAGVAGQHAGAAGTTLGMTLGALEGGAVMGLKAGGVGGYGNPTSDADAKMGAVPLFSDVTSKMAIDPSAGSAYQLSGGGMDVLGTLRAQSDFATQYQRQPMAGPATGPMLSDDRAKLAAAWDQGHAAAVSDMQKLATMPPDRLKAYAAERPEAAALLQVKADTYDEGARGQQQHMQQRAAAEEADRRDTFARAADMAGKAARYMGPTPAGAGALLASGALRAGEVLSDVTSKQHISDPMTMALADGAKPFAYEYKPGMGPPGPNVGPMAQDMLRNPVTATAVDQDPQTGLLTLDRDRSLKVALGGVGHLARKQAEHDALIQKLLAKKGVR